MDLGWFLAIYQAALFETPMLYLKSVGQCDAASPQVKFGSVFSVHVYLDPDIR